MSWNYLSTREKKKRDLEGEIGKYKSCLYQLGLSADVELIEKSCEGLGRRGDYLEYSKLKKLYEKFGGEKWFQ